MSPSLPWLDVMIVITLGLGSWHSGDSHFSNDDPQPRPQGTPDHPFTSWICLLQALRAGNGKQSLAGKRAQQNVLWAVELHSRLFR